ncbi:MAG: hypothetical protein IPK85_04000 [Gemmatimonadetes bacterium]|nr:hypothetical protein [Gemmatimonadota bacterium]
MSPQTKVAAPGDGYAEAATNDTVRSSIVGAACDMSVTIADGESVRGGGT